VTERPDRPDQPLLAELTGDSRPLDAPLDPHGCAWHRTFRSRNRLLTEIERLYGVESPPRTLNLDCLAIIQRSRLIASRWPHLDRRDLSMASFEPCVGD